MGHQDIAYLILLATKILTEDFSKLCFFFVFPETQTSEAAQEFLFPLLTKDKAV